MAPAAVGTSQRGAWEHLRMARFHKGDKVIITQGEFDGHWGTIIDKDVRIPPGFDIGWNRAADLARGLTVTDDGVTVVAKSEDLERFMPMGG